MTNKSIFDEDVVENYLKIKRKQVKCLGEALDEIHSAIQSVKDVNDIMNGIYKNIQELQDLIKDYDKQSCGGINGQINRFDRVP